MSLPSSWIKPSSYASVQLKRDHLSKYIILLYTIAMIQLPVLDCVESKQYLVIILDNFLRWDEHIDTTFTKVRKLNHIFMCIRNILCVNKESNIMPCGVLYRNMHSWYGRLCQNHIGYISKGTEITTTNYTKKTVYVPQ